MPIKCYCYYYYTTTTTNTTTTTITASSRNGKITTSIQIATNNAHSLPDVLYSNSWCMSLFLFRISVVHTVTNYVNNMPRDAPGALLLTEVSKTSSEIMAWMSNSLTPLMNHIHDSSIEVAIYGTAYIIRSSNSSIIIIIVYNSSILSLSLQWRHIGRGDVSHH